MTNMSLNLGLCKGRHKIDGLYAYIFDAIEDVTDVNSIELEASRSIDSIINIVSHKVMHINLFVNGVNGLTVALIAAVKEIQWRGITLTLWHYNRESGTYFSQELDYYD